MRLVSRHILRALAAPFVWGLAALTGLLLLQQLAPLIDKFGGRGLPGSIIVEAFLLTLPALLTLSLPMAVLVATLYGYSQLAGDLELVAMYANGISVWRMARPALLAAIFVAIANFLLYDQVVPRSNTRFSQLQSAVFRASPTLTFQPGLMNPITSYVLQARTIDPMTGAMTEVTIYDLRELGTSRIIHALHGGMKQTKSGADLLVSLDSGTIDEFKQYESNRFQRTYFRRNTLRIRDVTNQLNLATGGISRGDRDMTGCELLDEAALQAWYADESRKGIEYVTRRDLRWLLGLATLPSPAAHTAPVPHHCGKVYLQFQNRIKRLLLPAVLEAQAPQPPAQQPIQHPAPQQPVPGSPSTSPPVAIGTTQSGNGAASPFLVPPQGLGGSEQLIAGYDQVAPPIATLRNYEINVLRYQVEFQKKFAIPLASFCFVLLGMALALKYPRSGIGLVIGASMVIFLGFYILLIGGENMAKRGYLSPEVAIQGPLVLLTLLGLLAVASANREMGTARTAGILGSLVEFFEAIPPGGIVKALGVLDRYVLRQWVSTFVLSALGLPAVAILIDLSERFAKLVDKQVTIPDILIGQLYYFPNKIAMMLPAAVLFATVFTLNALGRNSELTAVKAGGVSFSRLIAPMMLLAVLSVPLDYGLQELSSFTTLQEKYYHRERNGADAQIRAAFGYASPSGWNWAVKSLSQIGKLPTMAAPVLEQAKPGRDGRWVVTADSAVWDRRRPSPHWVLIHGASVVVPDTGSPIIFEFRTLQHRAFTDPPSAMMDEGLKADEMTYPKLKQYISNLKLSGNDPGMLAVDLPLKFAVPLACLVVAMFGAPLAVTNPRAGAALGLAIALGTTLVYLTGIQVMKAIGGKGLLEPWLAAWSMNIVFFVVAIVLLRRVRS